MYFLVGIIFSSIDHSVYNFKEGYLNYDNLFAMSCVVLIL